MASQTSGWRTLFAVIMAMIAGLVWSSTADAQTKTSGKSKKLTAEQLGDSIELPTDKPIDLLALVEVPEHSLRGSWSKMGGSVVCEPAPASLVMVPVAVRGSYELDLEFTRRTHDDLVGLIFPVGATTDWIVFSWARGQMSGLGRLDGRNGTDIPLNSGAIVKPGTIKNGHRYHLNLAVTVKGNAVTLVAKLDDQRFVAWKGHAGQLSSYHDVVLPCPQAIGLAAYDSVVDFHKLELTVKKDGEGYQLGNDWKNPLTVVADQPPANIAKACVTWNGRKYFISDKPMLRSEAQLLAANWQGRLLTISSQAEYDFIVREGRGVGLCMAAYRRAGNTWRDERNRPLKFGHWAPGEPRLSYWESYSCIHTTSQSFRGLHDFCVWDVTHACIEWGEEYPPAK